MDWAELGTQIILSLVGVVGSALAGLLTYLISKYIKNDKLKLLMNSFNELIQNSVAEVYQTYVEALKKDNMFDKEAQAEALRRCLELINKNMPNDIKSWLDKNHNNIEEFIKDTIESHIALAKRTSKH